MLWNALGLVLWGIATAVVPNQTQENRNELRKITWLVTKQRKQTIRPEPQGEIIGISRLPELYASPAHIYSRRRGTPVEEATLKLAQDFGLTPEELDEFLPSGQQLVFTNRIGWARTYLKKAGLLLSPRRGYFQISSRGLAVLKENPVAIHINYLDRFPEFVEFRSTKKEEELTTTHSLEQAPSQTPHEALETAYERLRAELAGEVLQMLKTSDPAQFENIAVELLVKMGYGGSRKDAGRAIGRSGDEGSDGIIKEDHLGLDSIYVQAKRWGATVGRSEIQKFAGASHGQRARKGVFITTSDFSREATDYVSKIDSKIVLMDGRTLAGLMIDFGVGVTTVAGYKVKKLDADYFAEE